jgi:hypothetical protein
MRIKLYTGAPSGTLSRRNKVRKGFLTSLEKDKIRIKRSFNFVDKLTT